MANILAALIAFFLTACTITCVMTHTEGNSKDDVDTKASIDAKGNPTLKLPIHLR